MVCKCFLPFPRLPFHFIIIFFAVQKLFSLLLYFHLLIFASVTCACSVISWCHPLTGSGNLAKSSVSSSPRLLCFLSARGEMVVQHLWVPSSLNLLWFSEYGFSGHSWNSPLELTFCTNFAAWVSVGLMWSIIFLLKLAHYAPGVWGAADEGGPTVASGPALQGWLGPAPGPLGSDSPLICTPAPSVTDAMSAPSLPESSCGLGKYWLSQTSFLLVPSNAHSEGFTPAQAHPSWVFLWLGIPS